MKPPINLINNKKNAYNLLFCLLLAILILIPYYQVKNFGFISLDDGLYVSKNMHVQNGIKISEIKWAFLNFDSSNWHPITWLSHMFDCELYGLNPSGHHWTNLLIHIANSLLLFFILFHMTGFYWRSFLVAILFAIHPLHVESVVWISERKDVLSTLFFMLTLGAYYGFVKKKEIKRYMLVMIFLALGLMTKPMLVTTPFVLLLLDVWPFRRTYFAEMEPNSRLNPFNSRVLLHLISEKIPLFVLVIISSILTMIAQKSTHAVVPMEIITFKERVSNAILSYSNYLIKTMLPFNLSIYYPHLNNSFHNWKLVSCFILLLLITYMGLRFFYRYPYLLVGLLWFFGTLVPVIGLVQVGNQAMADRYTYIPLIGLFIAFVWSASDFFNKYVKNKKVIYPLILSVLIALTYLSHKQVGYWKSSISLYKHAVEATENNWFAHNLLGGAFYDNDEINESIFHFKESIKISPSFSSSHSNLAMALSRKRDFKEALSHYEIAIKLEPNDPIIFFNMGTTLSLMGKTDEAAKAFEKALAIDPDSADSQLRLAQIRHFQGNYDKAKYHYKKAITINPKLVDAHYKYGLLLIRLGDFKESFTQFSKVLDLDPNYAKAYFQIGNLLCYKGKMRTSRLFFQKALEVNPGYKEAYDKLKYLDNKIKSNGKR